MKNITNFSHIFQHNLPSPPGSPVVTSTTSGFGTPYEYDEKDYYQHQNKGYPFSTTTTSASGNGSVPANPNSHHHPRFANWRSFFILSNFFEGKFSISRIFLDTKKIPVVVGWCLIVAWWLSPKRKLNRHIRFSPIIVPWWPITVPLRIQVNPLISVLT